MVLEFDLFQQRNDGRDGHGIFKFSILSRTACGRELIRPAESRPHPSSVSTRALPTTILPSMFSVCEANRLLVKTSVPGPDNNWPGFGSPN